MTDAEIDDMGEDALRVAFAEQVDGYEYRPGKTVARPWYRGGYPCLESLPNYLSRDDVFSRVRQLTSWQGPFLRGYSSDRMAVRVDFDTYRYRVELRLLSRENRKPAWAECQPDGIWVAEGINLGAAFLRAMLKAAAWFRKHRGWEPS